MDSKKKTDNTKPVSNNVEKKKRTKEEEEIYNKVKKLDVDDKKAEIRKPVRQQPKKEVKVVKEEVEDVKDLEEDVKMLDLGDGSRFVVPRESATAGMSKAYRPPHHRGAKKRGDLPPSQPLGALRRASPQRRNFRKSPGGRRNQRRPYVPKQQQQQQRDISISVLFDILTIRIRIVRRTCFRRSITTTIVITIVTIVVIVEIVEISIETDIRTSSDVVMSTITSHQSKRRR